MITISIINKLDNLMLNKGITKAQLSKESGIPYTTIDGFYKKGTDNVKLSTLKRLSEYFNCSLDYLVDDEIGIEEFKNEYLKNTLLNTFDNLTSISQQCLVNIAKELLSVDENLHNKEDK